MAWKRSTVRTRPGPPKHPVHTQIHTRDACVLPRCGRGRGVPNGVHLESTPRVNPHFDSGMMDATPCQAKSRDCIVLGAWYAWDGLLSVLRPGRRIWFPYIDAPNPTITPPPVNSHVDGGNDRLHILPAQVT